MKAHHFLLALALGIIQAVHALASGYDPVLVGRWPGYTSGNATAVAAQGHYAFVGTDTGSLLVFDLENRTNNLPMAGCDLPGDAQRVVISGNLALVAGTAGLSLVDISDPARPHRVGSWGALDMVYDVAVTGNRAYVAGATVDILDISVPSAPILLGVIGSSIGFWGYAYAVAVQGNYAYVADGVSLWVVDVQDPAHPTHVGMVDWLGQSWSDPHNTRIVIEGAQMSVMTDYLFHVVDVSNPANPSMLSSLWNMDPLADMAIESHRAYLLDLWGGLQVVDFSNRTNLVMEGRLTNRQRSGKALALVGSQLCIAEAEAEVEIFEVSNPAAMQRLRGLSTVCFAGDVAVKGGRAMVTLWQGPNGSPDNFHILDVRDPSRPRPLGALALADAIGPVTLAGNLAYVGGYDLHIVDLSHPANPQRLGGCGFPGGARQISLAGNHAWIADTHGLNSVDISDPAHPYLVGDWASPGWAHGVITAGGLAFLADGDRGMHVMDISDPAHPQRLAGLTNSFYWPGARGLAAVGNHAILASRGLPVVDLSNPLNPHVVGGFQTTGQVAAVTVAGNLAYVACEEAGLLVLDLSNPTQPRRVGGYWNGKPIPHWANPSASTLAVAGDHLYVADGFGGLLIFRRQPPLVLENLGLVGGSFRLRISGSEGRSVQIQHTADLSNWCDLGAPIVLGATPTEFSDPGAASRPQCFYRVVGL